MADPYFCDWNDLHGKSLPPLTPKASLFIPSVDGQAILAACYLPAHSAIGCSTLRPSFTRLKTIPAGVLPAHVTLFNARGLITGDQIWIKQKVSETVEKEYALTTVRVAAFDHAQGTRSLVNIPDLAFVMLDAYGFTQRAGYVPTVSSWSEQVSAVLRNIHGHPLGKSLILAAAEKYPQRSTRMNLLQRLMPELPTQIDPSGKLVIRPYLRHTPNADSSISFTPDNWDGTEAGSTPEETLFHEFVHVSDGEFDHYLDADGFKFDGADFLSVTATNVYSSSLKLPLLKDHGEDAMPQKYLDDPGLYARVFRANINMAAMYSPSFFRALALFERPGLWNPFLPRYTSAA